MQCIVGLQLLTIRTGPLRNRCLIHSINQLRGSGPPLLAVTADDAGGVDHVGSGAADTLRDGCPW